MYGKISSEHLENRKEVKTMIKAVFLDWGATLVSGFKEIDDQIDELMGQYGLRWREVFSVWRNFYLLHSLGKFRNDQEMFDQFRKVLNLPSNFPAEKIRDLQLDSHIITPETIEVVKKIKQQYKVGIISNNVYDWVTQVLEQYRINELFDTVIVSSKIGVRKPDAKIFYAALKSIAAKPKETVFVSDELAEDLVGSKGLGIISVWLKDLYIKSEWKPKEIEDEIFQPDAVISSLKDLPSFLEKLKG